MKTLGHAMIKANVVVISMELADIDFDLLDLMSSCFDNNLITT